jgi:hypothetical protein
MLDIVTELPVNDVVDNKVNEPDAGVSHLSPVAVALSATILAMRIVLGTIADECA